MAGGGGSCSRGGSFGFESDDASCLQFSKFRFLEIGFDIVPFDAFGIVNFCCVFRY